MTYDTYDLKLFKSSILGIFPRIVQLTEWMPSIPDKADPEPTPDQEIIIKFIRGSINALAPEARAMAVKLETRWKSKDRKDKWDAQDRAQWGLLVCLCTEPFIDAVQNSILSADLKAAAEQERTLIAARMRSYRKELE